MRSKRFVRGLLASAAGGVACTAVIASAPAAVAETLPTGYHLRVFASGGTLTNPDDIANLRGRIFVAYQNNSQPDGSTSAKSTVVEYRRDGSRLDSWNLTGHVDGLTADPSQRRVIVTVNEDANSSLYTITPERRGSVRHYTYSPDPATLSGGGTDAISIVDGKILISASNPSPTTPGGSTYTGPAVYTAYIPRFGHVVTLTPTFGDNAPAVDAVTGKPLTLNLSDPDSNARVPWSSPRFAGDFMLVSQADAQLVFDRDPGAPDQALTVLSLNSSEGPPQVDDVRWTTQPDGSLFVTDGTKDQVDVITGPFPTGLVIAAIPSGSPLGGDLGLVDLSTGNVQPVATGFGSPKGELYLPPPYGMYGERCGHGHGYWQNDGRHASWTRGRCVRFTDW